jgi:hypothetical protein
MYEVSYWLAWHPHKREILLISSSGMNAQRGVPEFVLFSGEEKKSTIEHIARFSVQCGEARSKDYLKLRLFANSLTKSASPGI